MSEVWLPIPETDGLYEVSSLGRVYSHPRERTRGGFLKAPPNRAGYPEIHIYRPASRTWQVHVLVALVFLGPRPPGLEVRHLDGNKLNAALDNLAYGTRSQNMRDLVRHGSHNMATKARCKRGHDIADPENIYINPSTGSRQCRPCVRYRWSLRQAEKRAA